MQAKIIERKNHPISRANISPSAIKVLYRLHNHGYRALLVGGGVRDLLLGREPKDFDIATDARPEEIRDLFRNCRLIGRRFRLAHIRFGREIVEVATFRGQATADNNDNQEHHVQSEEGMIIRDNIYGTLEQDVWRRDFTVNALYYDIADFSIIDYVGGVQDVENKTLRLIGDPETRYREDPVRMIRAIRFSAKLDLQLAPDTAAPLSKNAELLHQVPHARLFEEFLKLFMNEQAEKVFEQLMAYDLLDPMFPESVKLVKQDEYYKEFVHAALANTSERLANGKSLAPGFLIAVFLWPVYCEAMKRYESQEQHELARHFLAVQDTFLTARPLSIPRRFTKMAREIWQMQIRLQNRAGKYAAKTFAQSRFRAGYDFLLLRAAAGEQQVIDLAGWWQAYVDSPEKERNKMAKAIPWPRQSNDG